jgi:cytosine/adenosine deaminase-related metal-dependent hydrolase
VLILTGEVVTFDAKRPHLTDGAVYIGDDQLIAAVQDAAAPPPPGFEHATRVDTGGTIYPGLIDLHNHIAYNVVGLWSPHDRTTPYTSRTQWPDNPGYGPDIKVPTLTLAQLAGKAVIRYVETKAVIGGVTAIQGAARTYHPFDGWLVRNVEFETFGGQVVPAHQSVVTLHDEPSFQRAAREMAGGSAFIYHLSEGTSPLLVREYADLNTHSCVGPHLVGIHCTALGDDQFTDWQQRAGTIVWSPFSNLWLYGVTAAVPDIQAAQLAVSLGTDWGPSGTKNLLGEVKVARIWSDHAGWGLTDLDLVRMITANPGDALARAWQLPVGRLVEGGLGDLTVLTRRHEDVWHNLVTAREADVALVAVGGRARYGTKALMDAAGDPGTGSLRVGGQARRLSLVRPDDATKGWTWTDVMKRLDAVRSEAATTPPTGPGAGRRRGSPAAPAGTADPPGTPPLVVDLDMPGGPGETAGPPPPGQKVDIAPIEPLHHDTRWLASLKGRGFHGGLLDGLRAYYR